MDCNLTWSYHIANTLYNLGVRDVCICPGSRNTPLIIAFSDNKRFNSTSHIDERSAGYFGLGIAKKKKSPVVIISTSGTAVANFLPAIIESNLSKTPLIVITADRPDYLINTGENQTINQQNIYGEYVRKFLDIGLPGDNTDKLINNITSLHNYSIGDIPGPVHINTPFEEPLVSKLIENTCPLGKEVNKKHTSNNNDKIKIDSLEESIIVCGELHPNTNHKSILSLSEFLSAPIFADPTSNIRYYKEHANIFSNYNLFLKNMDMNPKQIIRFGRKPTSKILRDIISNHKKVILIDEDKMFNDDANIFIRSELDSFVKNISESYDSIKENSILNNIRSIEKNIRNHISRLNINQMMCEGILIKDILDFVDADSNIFIGNSMAIREMDDLTINLNKRINIFANRGASGIDGLVSTALGISSVSRSEQNIAIIGDLSFYYDINSILFLSKLNIPLKIFILNNNGGGIFKQLPISKLNINQFEQYWLTPPNLNLLEISKSFDVKYHEVKRLNDLKDVFSDKTLLQIIDCKIDMSNNYKDEIIKLISS